MQNNNEIYSPSNRFAWVEISLNNLSHNLKLIKDYLNNLDNLNNASNSYKSSLNFSSQTKPKIMAVVKANAYGHGLIEISKNAIKSGADWLGVALVQEGMRLRQGGINAPILCLGSHSPEKIKDAVINDITLSVTSLESANLISELSKQINKKAKVHIKIDTGMNRIGINYNEAIKSINIISELPNLEIDGVFTHFACASKEDDSYTILQWSRFNKIISELKKINKNIKNYHCVNSAAFIRYPYMHLDMVRLGIIIYGINPFESNYIKFCDKNASQFISSLKPVLSLKAKISFIKKVNKGESISYCATFTTKRDSIIATIPIGYADGYSWNFSNKSSVIYNGCFAPVVGRVTMDQIMVDLTDCDGAHDAKVGDEVILIGQSSKDNKKILTANELADLIGTISYEIVCMIGDRIPRVYL